MRTLKLTSPYLHGADVRHLQQGLVKHGYLKGQADASYGPLTAQGTFRAKYWLGYRVPDQSASSLLMDYLDGKKQTTKEMKARAAQRKKAKPKVPMREKAYKWLAAHEGDKEHPAGSNKIVWASTWYGLTGPWCAMAVTRAYVEAGSKGFVRGRRWAYVPYVVNAAHAGQDGLAITTDPKLGDIVTYDWEGGGSRGLADHVGLFVKWTSGRQQFQALEGNTSVGNDSNGGEVMRRNRNRSQVVAFIHCAR